MTAARGELLQQVERLKRNAETVSAKVGGVEAEIDAGGRRRANRRHAADSDLRKQIESAVAARQCRDRRSPSNR